MGMNVRWSAAGAMVLATMMSSGTLAQEPFANLRDGQPAVVELGDGAVQGYASEGVTAYLGIPYAAPPLGELRWMPPVAPESWEGVLDAGAFGPSCLQTSTYGVFAERSEEEDCLYLNVFTPSDAVEEAPVMVWLHGGGLINGRGDDHDARALASENGVVVVTLNYRLNLFGFFSHPALDEEGHSFGNYGLLDQQAALRWVRDNIEAFGGDAGNVTLFGESAGGLAALFNMVSPGAEGLFHKIILQSGVSSAAQTPLETAQQIGLDFGTAIGCDDQGADCLRSASVEDILEKAAAFTGRATRVVDGTILPGQLQALLAAGEFHHVPVLMGNNHDEWTWFTALDEMAGADPVADDAYETILIRSYGDERAARILAEYPLENYGSASEALSVFGTSRGFICPSLRALASMDQFVPVYFYEFMDRNAPTYYAPVSFPQGAAHTLDLQYIFPGFSGAQGEAKALDADREALAKAMRAYWSNFAATGNPNGDALPEWPVWSPEDAQIQLLDPAGIRTASDTGIDRKCDFWNAL